MFLIAFAVVALCQCVFAVQVKVQQGTLEGTVEQLVTGDGTYNSFKGVPYAAPPIRDLRFRPPQPPLSWTGVRNASAHGSICTQYGILSGKITGTEDCLFLNVYTNNIAPVTPYPVMVYIPGGGNNAGSGNVDNFGPDFLVPFNVVLVTMNYRLDALGWLSLGTKDVQGNAGLKDQVAALQWVQANIAAFGGDPKNVTIFGQSTGGAAVTLHMMSPMSSGLFNRVISMSGTAFNEWAVPYEPTRRAFALGRLAGLDTEDPAALTTYLKSINASQLVGLKPNVLAIEERSRMVTKMYQWTAVQETDNSGNNFLTDDPLTILSNEGFVNDADFMIGHTNDEAFPLYAFFEASIMNNYQSYPQLLTPVRILDFVEPSTNLDLADELKNDYFGDASISNATTRQLLTYLSDCNYVYDIVKFAQLAVATNSDHPRYFYQFSANSKRNYYGNLSRAKYNSTGAGHLDDLNYIFDGKAFNLPIAANSTEYRLVKQWSTIFTNFAKYGDPTPSWITNSAIGDVQWPTYNSDGTEIPYLNFDTDAIKTGTDLDYEPIGFFDSVYQKSGVGYGSQDFLTSLKKTKAGKARAANSLNNTGTQTNSGAKPNAGVQTKPAAQTNAANKA